MTTKSNLPLDVVADQKIEVFSEITKARKKIERAIDQDGPYSHNMIGLTLSGLAKKCGTKYANELIDELELTSLYGIEKEL